MILILCLRGFGDAVIARQYVREIVKQRRFGEVHVLTLKKHLRIFNQDSNVTTHCVSERFGRATDASILGGLLSDLSVLNRLRSLRFDLSIDFVGDLRERLIALIINPGKHYYPIWHKSQPIGRLVRLNQLRLTPQKHIGVRITSVNVYSIHLELISAVLGGNKDEWENDSICKSLNRHVSSKIIAIHPFASQPSRMWNWFSWKELIRELNKRGYEIRVYCTKSEREFAEKMLGNFDGIGCKYVSEEDIVYIENTLKDVEIGVCLDSFFVHLCHSNHVKSVMINGSNNYFAWAPPTSEVVSNGLICNRFPCYNRPVCGDDIAWEYKCIKSVSVGQVLNKIIS